jgi:hypothetical protein
MALALRGLQFDLQAENTSNPLRGKKRSLSDFNYDRKDMTEILMNKITSLRFQGASVSPFLNRIPYERCDNPTS